MLLSRALHPVCVSQKESQVVAPARCKPLESAVHPSAGKQPSRLGALYNLVCLEGVLVMKADTTPGAYGGLVEQRDSCRRTARMPGPCFAQLLATGVMPVCECCALCSRCAPRRLGLVPEVSEKGRPVPQREVAAGSRLAGWL